MRIKYILLMLLLIVLDSEVGIAYTVVDVTDGATIRATVNFLGQAAAPDVYYMQKNPRVCGKALDAKDGARFISSVSAPEGHLEDVVVFLDQVDKGKSFPANLSQLSTFISKWCTWEPRVGVFVNGSSIMVTNLDTVVHNPIAYETVGQARLNHFNIPLHFQDTLQRTVRLRKGNFLKLECLQHQFMHSWIFRITNPYFAISRSHEVLEIDKIPPGNYVLHAWHPSLGIQTRSVTLMANEEREVKFEFY